MRRITILRSLVNFRAERMPGRLTKVMPPAGSGDGGTVTRANAAPQSKPSSLAALTIGQLLGTIPALTALELLHMKPITVVLPVTDETNPQDVAKLAQNVVVEELVQLVSNKKDCTNADGLSIEAGALFSGRLIERLVEVCTTEYLLVILPSEHLAWGERALERLVEVARDSGAGLVYSDYREQEGTELKDHPLSDYQPGSIRDNFDFGGAVLISRAGANRALNEPGRNSGELKWGGLYDLRLRLSRIAPIVHLPEPLYARLQADTRDTGERVFDYVDPSKRDYQIEMEAIATDHLRRIDALLVSEFHQAPIPDRQSFPVAASVIIPVRNRVKTITQAVKSGLSQKTDFDFNVVVVDNHSTDGTSEELARLALLDKRVVHLTPQRLDLGIGGCWNHAIYSRHCGSYAIQLDSDDLYSSTDTLARVIGAFRSGSYAMVIGAYKTIDFDLNELPPGLVDHREWTSHNGRNNALRINGLGAPRAFNVGVLRQFGFPNVSYGEDYAVALRLSRDYEIGRIYEPLYMARRWGGNSDSALPLTTMKRYDHYKDWIRTNEIRARQSLNGRSQTGL